MCTVNQHLQQPKNCSSENAESYNTNSEEQAETKISIQHLPYFHRRGFGNSYISAEPLAYSPIRLYFDHFSK